MKKIEIGTLVRFKHDGDLGIVAEVGQDDTLVYWLRIRKQGSVKNNLLELVELETK